MTEQETPEPVPEQEIEFRDRRMRVRMPSPEQILVWKRTLTKLQAIQDDDSWTVDKMMMALERARKIIDTVLVDPDDVAWLDDEFLEGTLTFETTAPIITLIVDAFAEANTNRADRRATKRAPAKRAVRKAPTPKVAS